MNRGRIRTVKGSLRSAAPLGKPLTALVGFVTVEVTWPAVTQAR